MSNSDSTVSVFKAKASALVIECPACNAEQENWIKDPRGDEHECDACGKTYRVSIAAQIEII
ncbi:hypothetical protein [Iodobacter fluviatilis]|uniref:Uncharacterized protein n=1 Tax=Iodobacter fluviatilis TaxID=537 RepID=A0A7G3GEK8_9NEIS|nr:hypothetical protein [Iodobacter fluviatilis]QBC45887.1 hypothetical protein C1H71_20300 [Iodobacter fluviatilis]